MASVKEMSRVSGFMPCTKDIFYQEPYTILGKKSPGD